MNAMPATSPLGGSTCNSRRSISVEMPGGMTQDGAMVRQNMLNEKVRWMAKI